MRSIRFSVKTQRFYSTFFFDISNNTMYHLSSAKHHFQLLSKKEGNLKEMNGFEVEMGVIFDTLNTILSSTICHLIRDSFSEERKTLCLDCYVFFHCYFES